MKKIIVGNIKMNILSPEERDKYISWMKKEIVGKKLENVEVVVCPPYVHFEAFEKEKGKVIKLGAQNMFPEKCGAYTGEISPIMLKNFGCEYVILGHSARRRFQGENNEEINRKIISALQNGLTPIVCIGEKKEEMARGKEVIEGQLEECFFGVKNSKIKDVVICYEPVWAISANNPDHLPTTNEIMSYRLLIRKILAKKYGVKNAEKVRIIYGGSVDFINAKQTCLDSEMDGALVGKESLLPNEFIKIAALLN
jgi:triosephosphate isomerase (TIM)